MINTFCHPKTLMVNLYCQESWILSIKNLQEINLAGDMYFFNNIKLLPLASFGVKELFSPKKCCSVTQLMSYHLSRLKSYVQSANTYIAEESRWNASYHSAMHFSSAAFSGAPLAQSARLSSLMPLSHLVKLTLQKYAREMCTCLFVRSWNKMRHTGKGIYLFLHQIEPLPAFSRAFFVNLYSSRVFKMAKHFCLQSLRAVFNFHANLFLYFMLQNLRT